ncbi:LacI family DNA-binding transcriptional regulator [Lactobacillus ultunensis]|uniref:Transcriptional regulator, LacI family n=1 Tax=Lactobacillus ultunensis DSM 16047 TaxID=525365 RepID=C2EKX8_9LACO|nr:LacI family DNA-binding transcriptional regulator [Lactobacillus ultunensis]EEJ72835.1 transcriptional regulator, LacI family [Lactobacillus ultunensis DSM 16047]KRL83102.1 LacI family transcriptional regulator LacR [Lactobacillus ultunensis DSM 16047]QQP29169.1 LacI family DNA-binding transcriptional regulator [Lactobacillus ultunensis]
MTTIKEIALESGYSSATVSRLLNNDPNLSITADTKNKILEIANRLGYWKDHQEKKIRPTIALLYRVNHEEQLQDEYFTSLKQALISTVEHEALEMKTFYDINDLIDNASSFQGFIGVGAGPIENASLRKLHEVLPNGVFVDTNPAPELFDSIRPNLSLTVKNAIDLFIKNGYERIGFIGGFGPKHDHIQETDIRSTTFADYIKVRGKENKWMFVDGPFSVENGYKLGKRVIAKCKGNLPDAFLIASDTLAVGVLQAFNEKNINVPKDTAILSINNSNVVKYVSPPLSSYNINQQEMIDMALDMLTNLIIKPDRAHMDVNMNTNLVVRKSFIPKAE